MLADNIAYECALNYRDGFSAIRNIECLLVHDGGMKVEPRISIMIPTYNRPELLKEAIDSALNQKTDVPFEVVVVDNGTEQIVSNKLDELVSSYRESNLRLFRNSSNIGMFGNWNRCITLARGCYITILNDDDILHSDYLECIKWEISQGGRSAILVKFSTFGRLAEHTSPLLSAIKESILRLRQYILGTKKITLGDILYRYPAAGSLGILFKKDDAIAIGGFMDVDWPISDYVFMCKYWNAHGLKMVTKTLAKYRWDVNVGTKQETILGYVSKGLALRHTMARLHLKTKFPYIIGAFHMYAALSLIKYKNKICPSLTIPEIFYKFSLTQKYAPPLYNIILKLYWKFFDLINLKYKA